MNERLRELMVQADYAAPEIALRAQKLAELIVRECCIALNPMLRDMISRGQGVDMIKLHFGMNPNEITTRMLDTAIEQCKQELAERNSNV